MFIILLFSSVFAKANARDLILVVREPIKVYQKPSRSAEVISTLESGDEVAISRGRKGAWRAVKWWGDDDKQVKGFVRTLDFKLSKIMSEEDIQADQRRMRARPSSQKYIVGLGFRSSQLVQGEFSGEFSEIEMEVGEATSTQSHVQIQFSLPLDSQWALRVSVFQRKTSFEGTATQEIQADEQITFSKTQELFAAAGIFQWRSSRFKNLWMGPGIEFAQGDSVLLEFNGNELLTNEEDLPFFVIGSVNLGYDIPIFENLFFTVETGLGFDVNSDPITTELAFGGGLSWAF